MRRVDVLVVGGGAMGAATTSALARRGVDVALVEQFGEGHDRGSSHGASRIFRLAYRQPHFVRLAQQALRAWRELSEAAGVDLLTTTGGVDHGDATALVDISTSLGAAGASFSTVAREEAALRWPALRFAGDVLHQPDAGRIAADEVLRALHRLALEAGASVSHGVGVRTVVDRGGEVEVVTDDEVLRARVAVLAVGAWLPGLAGSLRLDLPPLTVTQEQPAYFPLRDVGEWPVFVHYGDLPHYGLLTPGLGVKVGEHGSGAVVDPDARPPVDTATVQRLSSYVEQWLPGALPSPTQVDSCLYTTTPDEEFVLKRMGRIVICSACSGHGFKFTPVIGERVATLALAG